MSRREAEKVEVGVTMKRETDRAILINDGDHDIWLPKSQCEVEGGQYPEAGETFNLMVADWLAKDKGLI